MKNDSYLKNLLIDLIDDYKKILFKTSSITITFTIFTFVLIGFLLKFSNFSPSALSKQDSLLSFFFTRYSYRDIYSIVDLSKTVFIFFVSIFSIGMIRINKSEEFANGYKFGEFIKHILFMDFIYLIGVFIICWILDYLLFQLDSSLLSSIDNKSLSTWTHKIDLFIFRIYLPLVIFSIAIFMITSGRNFKVTLKSICYLLVSLWIINEFAYELIVFIRSFIFSFILVPFDQDNKFLFESFLGIVLIAFLFVGYYSVMTKSVILLEDNYNKNHSAQQSV